MNKGADLECHLSYIEPISASLIVKVVEIFLDTKFIFTRNDALLLYGEDFFDPIKVCSSNSLNSYVDLIHELPDDITRVLLNFQGELHDVFSTVSLQIDLDNSVISVSVLEAFIWGFDTEANKPSLDRLLSFYKIIRQIGETRLPKYCSVSNSGVLPYEMNASTVSSKWKAKYAYSADALSSDAAKKLFEWYTTEYITSTR